MKKRLGLRLVVIMFTIIFSASQMLPFYADAASVDAFKEFDTIEIYSVNEIMDINTLEMRAEKGIDDLKARTGIKFEYGASLDTGESLDVLYTTQLLSIVEYEGKQYEQYAVTTIVDFAPTSVMSGARSSSTGSENTQYNYRLINRVYYTMDSDCVYYYYQHSMTVYLTTGTVTATPQTLFVENYVYFDQTEYAESPRHISNYFSPLIENNPYILSSPYTGALLGWMSSMNTRATLTLSDGTSVTSFCGKQCVN